MTSEHEAINNPIRKEEIKHFKDLFEKYYDGLFRYGTSLIEDQETARGMVQEVFLKLWERKDTLRHEEQKLKAYLFTTLHNQCLNRIRHQKVIQSFASDRWHEWLQYRDQVPEFNPFVREALAAAIEELPDRARECFCLTQLDGLSHKAVAKTLGLSEKTIENQVRIARKKLRKKLSAYYK